jgi:site-specific recombinase XerC
VVKGKGRKDCLVYLADGAFDALEAWLDLRGRMAGSIFCRSKGRGRKHKDGQVRKECVISSGRGLTEQAIDHVLAKRRT